MKQSVRPLVTLSENDFTVFCSSKVNGFLRAFPYWDRGGVEEENRGFYLCLPIKNVGADSAISVVVEWNRVPESYLRPIVYRLFHGKPVNIDVADNVLKIGREGEFRSFHSLGIIRTTIDHIPASRDKHELEDVFVTVPTEMIIVMMSGFEKQLKDNRLGSLGNGVEFRVKVKCKDISGRSVMEKYLVCPYLKEAVVGREERRYHGTLQVIPRRSGFFGFWKDFSKSLRNFCGK